MPNSSPRRAGGLPPDVNAALHVTRLDHRAGSRTADVVAHRRTSGGCGGSVHELEGKVVVAQACNKLGRLFPYATEARTHLDHRAGHGATDVVAHPGRLKVRQEPQKLRLPRRVAHVLEVFHERPQGGCELLLQTLFLTLLLAHRSLSSRPTVEQT